MEVQWEPVAIGAHADDKDSDLLGLEIVVSENSEEALDVVRGVAEQVAAELLVSDGLDTYRRVADDRGLDQQMCRNHMKRNADALADELRGQLKKEEPLPGGIDSSPERIVEDWEDSQRLVRERPAQRCEQLEELYDRHRAARQPPKGQRHTVWYRMRMLITRLWDRWARLTLDQRRDDLDGTDNSSERMIGWWMKERCRTMRGYKRTEAARNVVTITAGMAVRSGHYDMAELYA